MSGNGRFRVLFRSFPTIPAHRPCSAISAFPDLMISCHLGRENAVLSESEQHATISNC
jgi:hypothetical protein